MKYIINEKFFHNHHTNCIRSTLDLYEKSMELYGISLKYDVNMSRVIFIFLCERLFVKIISAEGIFAEFNVCRSVYVLLCIDSKTGKRAL